MDLQNKLNFYSAFGIGLNSGSGVVSFVLAPETLTQSARAVGISASVFFMWISFVLVSFSVPFLFVSLNFYFLLAEMDISRYVSRN